MLEKGVATFELRQNFLNSTFLFAECGIHEIQSKAEVTAVRQDIIILQKVGDSGLKEGDIRSTLSDKGGVAGKAKFGILLFSVGKVVGESEEVC